MKRYRIEIDIFEGQGGQLVKEGDQIIYPDNFETLGICAWMYRGDGTPYEKVIDPDGITTEFKVCCWTCGATG